jgi:hypothetical protein
MLAGTSPTLRAYGRGTGPDLKVNPACLVMTVYKVNFEIIML